MCESSPSWSPKMLEGALPPFAAEHALDQTPLDRHVPGHPLAPLERRAVETFLDKELNTKVLDGLANRLWLFTTPASNHIDPLHASAVKSRSIVVCEDSTLHLVWHRNKVFIKPIPRALLNYQFWHDYLCKVQLPQKSCSSQSCEQPGTEIHDQASFDERVACGFLRSYSHLIKHESDLGLALEKRLVPSNTTWTTWCNFITAFRDLDDDQVSPRYHYGQLRLTRLNYAVRIFRPSGLRNHRHYYEAHWDTLSFLERFLSPLLFIFASASVLLSAMQVMLTLPLDATFEQHHHINIWSVKSAFWGFGIFTLISVLFSVSLLLMGPIVYLTAQLAYGWKLQLARTSKRAYADTRSVDIEKIP